MSTAAPALDRHTVHGRLRRGWSEDRARSTPKMRRWGATQGLVYTAILARPGIGYRELRPLVKSDGALHRALSSLLKRKAITMRAMLRDGRAIRGYWPNGEPLEIVMDRSPLVVQRPFVNPIRARALGLAR